MEGATMQSERNLRILLIACCSGVFIMPLMSTMMNLAIPTIEGEFHVGSHSSAMINTTFLLASVIAMVPIAKLSDIYGRRPIFYFGLVLTLVSSILATVIPSFDILLVLRFAMGVGSAAISMSSIVLLTDMFPAHRRGWAIGWHTTFVYLAVAFGPTLSGVLIQLFGWRSLFLLIIPICMVSLLFLFQFKGDVVSAPNDRMDVSGAIFYGVAISILMYGVISLPEPYAIVMVAAGLALMVLFIRSMRSKEAPVLDVGVFKYRVFLKTCIATFMNYGSSYSISFFMSLYLQGIGALTPLEAGLMMLIQPVFQIVLTIRCGRLSDTIENKRLLPTLGMAITAVAVLMIVLLGTEVNYYYIAAIFSILGIGYGIFSAPNTSALMSSVPPRNRGEASGMATLVRQTGMMFSMGIAMCCISIFMGSLDNLNPDTFDMFIQVIRASFIICFIMCVIGVYASWTATDEKGRPE